MGLSFDEVQIIEVDARSQKASASSAHRGFLKICFIERARANRCVLQKEFPYTLHRRLMISWLMLGAEVK